MSGQLSLSVGHYTQNSSGSNLNSKKEKPRISFQAGLPAVLREEALDIFAQFANKTGKEIRCDNGHALDRQRYRPEVQDDAGYDCDWKCRESSE